MAKLVRVFDDFRGLEIPVRALELGFTDCSWSNDAAARMELILEERLLVTLWIGDEYTAEETGGERYALVLDVIIDPRDLSATEECTTIVETDNLDRVLAEATRLVKFIKTDGAARTVDWIARNYAR